MKVYSRLALLLLICTGSVAAAWGQGIQTEFGKNRVQYSRDFDEWVEYESENFITYWYGEARTIGQAVVLIAELEHNDIQRLLEHRVNDKLELIVYTDLSDLKQSNIGLEDAFTNVTGQTKIFDNKIFVYFNGDHQHLRRQIREGIAGVYLESMLFGANLQEFVQNTILFSMPEWFRLGLISYVGSEWNSIQDDKLRRLFAEEKMRKFEDFVKQDPVLAGHAFWYFVTQQYNRNAIANILYISRIYRDVEEGMLYVLGASLPILTTGWYHYFNRRYEQEALLFDPDPVDKLPIRNRHNPPISQLAVSPDGSKLGFVTNRIGKVKVNLYDLRTRKQRQIFKYGFRNPFQATDFQYPHIAWHPSGDMLAIVYERRDKIFLLEFDLKSGKKLITEIPPIFQRIYSMHYFDPQRLLFTGATGGVSDVMIFHIPTRQTERITNDFWDDLEAAPFTFRGKKGILFSSNRPHKGIQPQRLGNVPPIGRRNLFFYNYDDKGKELVPIMQGSEANAIQPERVDDTWFTWLSDHSGIYNRYVGHLDSVVVREDHYFQLADGEVLFIHGDSLHVVELPAQYDSTWTIPQWEVWAYGHPVTNAGTHLLRQSVDRAHQKVWDVRREGMKWAIYGMPLNVDAPQIPQQVSFRDGEIRRPDFAPVPARPVQPRRDSIVYYFQSPFDYDDGVIPDDEAQQEDMIFRPPGHMHGGPYAAALPREDTMVIAHQFNSSRIIPSRLKFRLDNITNRFDNTLLFGGLDNFYGRRFLNLNRSQAVFTPPPAGLLLKAEVKDLFEDYDFEGGFRLPTNFRGSEFFLTFSDYKRRWDKRYSVYRGDWSNIFDLNQNVINGPARLVPPGLGGPGSPNQFKVRMQTTLGQVDFRYPLDIFRSFRFRTTLRNDRYYWHSLDRNTLEFPAVNEQRLGLRAAYVFDNTLQVSANILNGMRYTVFTEVMKGFQVQADPFEFSINRGFLGVTGFDFRYYLPIMKHSVLALRANSMVSFGQERILFYLGGMDNWVLPQFNNTIPVANEGYAFQTLAANLRGFQYNIRNGSSFALINTELRIPFVRHIFPHTRSAFFQNLQVTGFFDAGTAWEGISPYNDDNPLNILELQNPPSVFMRVRYFRDPIVAGYGVGMRALLFGYLVKLDYAWGVETGVVQKPILYLSIGADF